MDGLDLKVTLYSTLWLAILDLSLVLSNNISILAKNDRKISKKEDKIIAMFSAKVKRPDPYKFFKYKVKFEGR